MVQLSIRTKSFYLKLAQSYIFFFVYFRAKHNHLLQNLLIYFFCKLLIYFYRQCVSLSVSFFACSYSSLNGEKSLSRAVWSCASGAPFAYFPPRNRCRLFSVKHSTCKRTPFNREQIPFDYHTTREKKKQLSQLVRQRREKVSICSSSLRITFYHPEAELCLKSTVGRILIRWETAALMNGREQANRSGLRMTLSAHKRRLSEQ